jgi:hypothetical protein
VDVTTSTAAAHFPLRSIGGGFASCAIGKVTVCRTEVVASIAHGGAAAGRQRVWGATHGAGSTQHAVVTALASIGARGRRDEAVALGGNHRRDLLQRAGREAIGVGLRGVVGDGRVHDEGSSLGGIGAAGAGVGAVGAVVLGAEVVADLVGGGEDVLPCRHDAIDAQRGCEARIHGAIPKC